MDSAAQSSGRPVALRTIDDVETLKALCDRSRLAILRTLMAGAHVEPRVMSVKELANELGEPQTKLYRHVRQLEACGLIEVAQTRLVSGIVEQRYRTGQFDLTVNRSLLTAADPDDQAAMTAALFDHVRDDLVAGLRSGRLRPGAEPPPGAARLRSLFGAWETTIAPAKAQEFQQRLELLLDEIGRADTDENGIPLVVLATMYTPGPAAT